VDQLRLAVAILGSFAAVGLGQARVVTAPPEPSLLNLTDGWSRASSLGDLRELKTASDHIELRVWAGFGMMSTQGVVLRRAGGQWTAFLATVRRCEIQIPKSVADTASRATMQYYVAEARRQCATPRAEVGAGARIITADTLVVEHLDVSDSLIADAWEAAVRAGVSQLPGSVRRDASTSSDFTYVVELRRGNEYRASQVDHVEAAEAAADRHVREVYAAISSILPPDRLLKP